MNSFHQLTKHKSRNSRGISRLWVILDGQVNLPTTYKQYRSISISRDSLGAWQTLLTRSREEVPLRVAVGLRLSDAICSTIVRFDTHPSCTGVAPCSDLFFFTFAFFFTVFLGILLLFWATINWRPCLFDSLSCSSSQSFQPFCRAWDPGWRESPKGKPLNKYWRQFPRKNIKCPGSANRNRGIS